MEEGRYVGRRKTEKKVGLEENWKGGNGMAKKWGFASGDSSEKHE